MNEIAGYRQQPSESIGLVNVNKAQEEEILKVIDSLEQMDFVDKRWLAIGKTKIQEAYMAINRAILQPKRL